MGYFERGQSGFQRTPVRYWRYAKAEKAAKQTEKAVHRTLRTSPAMAAGVTTRLWEVSDIVELLQQAENSVRNAA